MNKLKSAWKNMTIFEKAMVSIRDMGCLCLIITALLQLFGLIPYGIMAAVVLLPAIVLAQAGLSWKRSKATAIFFLVFLGFFFFVFFVSKG